MYASVLVELKAKALDKTFTYSIPSEFAHKVKIGIRVLVPFGKQKLEGFVLDIFDTLEDSFSVKSIIDCVDEKPVLNTEMLKLGKYIQKKTLCTLISAYQTMLPSALKAHHDFVINKKYDVYIKLLDKSYIPKNKNQEHILELLKKEDVLKKVLLKISTSSVNTLIKNKVVVEIKKEVYRLNNNTDENDTRIELNKDQKSVVKEVVDNLNHFKPYLLHGVTGSGKTEVYMNIIENVLLQNKQVIVLVPEISLTPQMVNLFKKRFKNSIAILHSGLSNGEKYDEYRRIMNNEVNIVIGARSAVFSPLTNIGFIVVDEEHSDTYKQESNPKYSAIDIAIKRAKYHNCPVLFASATPTVESYTRAKLNIYTLLELKHRVNNNMPITKVIDMKKEYKKGNSIFSSLLIDKINDRLDKHEQIILFLNRRGYSTTITCKECGDVIKCPNCDIPLTYHKRYNKLNCHYCNYTTYRPKVCPSCKSDSLVNYGLGTEKLEEEVNKLFDCRSVRMDVDTTSRKGSHERILTAFKNHEYDILIGTQMISKGLDFPLVTLVGIINADSSLNIPDFRSGERTFDLINQVSGRSGRSDKQGEVIIQCFNTEHYSIKTASMNDYISFYDEEINIRKKLKYPPFCNLCLIKLIGLDLDVLNKEAMRVKEFLINNTKSVQVLGPTLSALPKINNKYYIQIILKYKNIMDVYNQIKFLNSKLKSNTKVVIDIDFDPKKI